MTTTSYSLKVTRPLTLAIAAGLLLVTLGFYLGVAQSGSALNLIFCAVMLAALTGTRFSPNERSRSLGFDTLIIAPLIYMAVVPTSLLIEAGQHGGYSYFADQLVGEYIYQEAAAVVVLALTTVLYARVCQLHTGVFAQNLRSPLAVVLYARLFWITLFEPRHLAKFAEEYGHMGVEYVVLVSIPLFMGILVLTLWKNLTGYRLGIVLGLLHVILTLYMVIARIAPGFGPIIVISASLGIVVFSFRGMVGYYASNQVELPPVAPHVMRFVLRIKGFLKDHAEPLHQAGLTANMKVLDYGCGPGNYTIQAAKITGAGGRVVAVDLDAGMLGVVRQRTQSAGLSNVDLIQENHPQNLGDGDFDLILLIDVLHLIKERADVLDALLDKLAPGGRILVKFEHFDATARDALLGRHPEASKTHLKGQYWLLSNPA